LIDHAWGREPTRISDIKAYKTKSHSITSGQVLMREYSCCEGRVIVAEMAEALCLDLVRDALVCSSVSICIGYGSSHSGEYESASVRLSFATNADSVIVNAVCSLYDRIADKAGGIRRINISFNNVSAEDGVQYSLFDDTEALEHNRRIQNTMIDIKKKYGRNAILKGINYDACSTARERNMQIGGHKSGRTNSAGNADIR
ncbi:MAG: DNA repair protein, partial [Clostridia bacterium]|nr:DNA repair protein [Clostridia bacterium]